MTVRNYTLLAVLLLASIHAGAQAETYVGRVKVQIGMPERFVLAQLTKEGYKIKSDHNVYFVQDADGRDLGLLIVSEGKLAVASSTLYASNSGDAASLVVAYRVAAHALANDTGGVCQVTTVHDTSDGNETNGVIMDCGTRKLKLITVTESSGAKSTAISEEVGEFPSGDTKSK